MTTERMIYSQTGEIGKDGILTQEQRVLLNNIQEKAAINALSYLDGMKEGDPYPMVAMATGIGKGRIIHKIIEREMRRKQDQKVMLIAGTKLVLVRQTHEALLGYKQESREGIYVESEEDDELLEETTTTEDDLLDNQQSFVYKTGKIRQQDANVHVGTIQTVQSEVNRARINPDDYGLEIVDEVHNIGTPKRKAVVQKFKRIIGFTATPYRHSGRMKSPEQYGFKVIEPLPLPEAQKLRLLPPLLGIQADTKNLVDEIPTTSTGKIDYAMLEKVLKESPALRPFIADRVSKIISDGDRRYKTVIAVNFVWEAEELAQLLHEKGIKVGIAVNKQASKEIHTEEIPALDSIERYKLPESDDRSIQVLVSPYVASEGFDAPFTEVLVWASPTDSELRYTQYTGRLARRNEGKLFGLIVDFLYQTNKYGWNYNMAMWMKDDVKQLENGMLWLGPETDIESLKRLPQVEAMRRQADLKPLTDLQREGLLEVQETDFPITQSNLIETFRGKYQRVRKVVNEALEEIRSENGDLIKNRTSANNLVIVVTDKEKFIALIKKKGIEMKDISLEEVKETDFVVTSGMLRIHFTGSSQKTASLAKKAVESLKQGNPNVLAKRRTKVGVVSVVTDKKTFIDAMVAQGAGVKEEQADIIEDVKPTDFAITVAELKRFRKGYEKNMTIVNQVLEQLRAGDSQSIQQRKSGNSIVTVVTDRERFMEAMFENGAVVSEEGILEVKPNDFVLSSVSLTSTFRGEYRKLRDMLNEIVNKYSEKSPDLFAQRKNGKATSNVFSDRELFIREMLSKGAELK